MGDPREPTRSMSASSVSVDPWVRVPGTRHRISQLASDLGHRHRLIIDTMLQSSGRGATGGVHLGRASSRDDPPGARKKAAPVGFTRLSYAVGVSA